MRFGALAPFILAQGLAHAQSGALPDHSLLISFFGLLALFAAAGIANLLRRGSIFGYDPPPEFADVKIIAERAMQSHAILSDLSKKDGTFDEKQLRSIAQGCFTRLFTSLSNQAPGPLKKILRNDLLGKYEKLMAYEQGLGIRRACEKLNVERIEIVLVRSYKAREMDEYTAWVRARASRYQQSEDEKVLTEEKAVRPFEHFLSFQRSGDSWLLCHVEEVKDAHHILATDNIVETLGEDWEKKAEQNLLLSPSDYVREKIAVRAGRAAILLSRLSRAEPHWNQARLTSMVRETYAHYYGCLSKRDFSPMRHCMSGQFYHFAGNLCREMKGLGITIEARGLSVRDVEIVLVKNRRGSTCDEFTAHVLAHAQVAQLNPNGEVVGGDFSIRQFQEYMTFVHHDGWMLEEMVAPGEAQGLLSEENLDEESLPPEFDWYYKMLPPDKLAN